MPQNHRRISNDDVYWQVVSAGDDMRDAKKLLQDFAQVITHEHGFDDDGIADDLANDLSDYTQPRSVFVLAYLHGQPAGCLALRPLPGAVVGLAELKRMYVAPQARGYGLGKSLLDVVEHHARAFGYDEIYLSSLNSFTHAHALYQRHGYQKIAPYNEGYPEDRVSFFGKKLQLLIEPPRPLWGCRLRQWVG